MEGWWAASYAVLWLLVIALAAVVVALARQVGTLHLRLGPRGALEIDDEGPPLGELLEPHDAIALGGDAAPIGGPGRAQLILFVSPGCRMCEEVLPALPALARRYAAEARIVTDVDHADSERAFARGASAPVIAGADIVARYGIPGTPYVVAIDERGIVRAKGTVNNLEQLEGLVDTARNRAAAGDGVAS